MLYIVICKYFSGELFNRTSHPALQKSQAAEVAESDLIGLKKVGMGLTL
jgi:hypothetical protein